MVIRSAHKEDIAAIADFIRAFADYHHELESTHKSGAEYTALEETVAEWLGDREVRIFVAEEKGALVGYLRASIENAPTYLREKKIGTISDTYVEPSARGRGALTALFNEVLVWFKKKCVLAIELNVLAQNTDAIAAWRTLGFKEYRLRMRRLI